MSEIREKPYSYSTTPSGTLCIYKDGSKIAEVLTRGSDRYRDAAFMVAAMNSRHNYLKYKKTDQWHLK